jgi:hypothetical protein
MPRFHVTYDHYTPESAEDGDYSESGFAAPGGWRFELRPGVHGPGAGKVKDDNSLTLREALEVFRGRGRGIEDNGNWFYECEGDIIDYGTGTEERLALHCPDNITGASLGRVRRLLGLDKAV